MNILALNAGSSSLKAEVFCLDESPGLGAAADPVWKAEGRVRVDDGALGSEIRQQLGGVEPHPIDLIAHRIVRTAAPATVEAELLTDEVGAAIRAAVELAPEHTAVTLETIAASRERFPVARQVAVYDSAFHRTIPMRAAAYAGPYAWVTEGFRKVGFHGLSHAYCSRRATAMLGQGAASPRIIVAHLGSGASLAAVRDGQSADTTMGFTPLDGLMMSTRSGSVDPGLLLYLLRTRRYTVDALEHLLNDAAGLRGMSGRASGDLREIIDAADRGDERAALAFGVFLYRLRSAIGSMAAALEGLDALVFTGGIGEHSTRVRNEACSRLGFLGVAIDQRRNDTAAGDTDISTDDARVRTMVISTREGWEMSRLAYAVAR